MSDADMLMIIRKMQERYDLRFSERMTLAVLAGRLIGRMNEVTDEVMA